MDRTVKNIRANVVEGLRTISLRHCLRLVLLGLLLQCSYIGFAFLAGNSFSKEYCIESSWIVMSFACFAYRFYVLQRTGLARQPSLSFYALCVYVVPIASSFYLLGEGWSQRLALWVSAAGAVASALTDRR